MAPGPQEFTQYPNIQETNSGDNVVISGMSGDFPLSNGVSEFSEILYSKINPVNCESKRWKHKHPEVSEYLGTVSGLDRFDSQFFMVHKHLAESMEPMARKVLEHSFQAIYDAGLSPKLLSDKKVGVYVAATFSETEARGVLEQSRISGYSLTGTSKAMFANRISYWLNAKGPSITIDDGCNGSMVALEEAYNAINSGLVDAAIVGGTYICLAPHNLVHYHRCIQISPDEKTKSFDQNANGCTKSEAICVLFLQRAKTALRAYAEVIHVKNEFTSRLSGKTGQMFGFCRNPDASAEFLKHFYAVARVSPNDVEYVEACGSGTPEADKAELQSIEKVFCENRSDPLLVGSVISNIGFNDAAYGVTAITKVLLGYHNGLIASNLHCDTPRQDIAAIQDGRMRIVTDHQPFRGTYAAVNCLSYTGVNSHVLLRGINKVKNLHRYSSPIPRLLTMSARQDKFLKSIFDMIKCLSVDAEQIALLHNIHSANVSGHLGRGYVILDTNEKQETICLAQKIEYYDDTSRPLWFVYSGMGSQWAGMGTQLMRIPIFAAAIERCRNVLEPLGIDIVHIITSLDKTIFDNVLNSFVGIAAIQIGITDILTILELKPDKIIGHSVGELGCAYADGCLTAEEMILAAYSRGKASNDALLIKGAMAAVGLGFQQLSKLCPPAIEIACHNSSSSCTISGPEEAIREFVAMLTANKVFAREVPSANIAYHSRYIADAGPHLLQMLSEIIKEPRARSERWLSTSVPQKRWSERAATYCSAEYLTNNLLSPVLFEETSSLIPANAVLVEIAPHGLLQAILKRALPDSCTNIPLTQRGHKDNALFLLEAVGKLYIEGFQPRLQAIYPKVEFPVSSGTPHLSHLVQWFHDESWTVKSGDFDINRAASCTHSISVQDDEHRYLTGNVVKGKNLYPFAGALVAVWDTLAMTLGLPKKKTSVRFRDVNLYSQPILHDQKLLKLNVSLQRGSGRFEVLDGKSKVANGFVEVILKSNLGVMEKLTEKLNIGSNEIYKYLRSRGFSYREDFQSIDRIDESISAAQILWNDNWVTFIDGLLQLNILRSMHQGTLQPAQIRDLTINIHKHAKIIEQSQTNGKILINTKVDEVCDYTSSGGVLIHNLELKQLPHSNDSAFDIIPFTSDLKAATQNNNLSIKEELVLGIGDVGNLDTLRWEDAPAASQDGGIPVQVEYASINALDANRATGLIPYKDSEKYFGMDFSGLTKNGSRVMGLVRNGAARTEVCARPELLWPVPAHWTLEDAATVPLAYTQAFYYLCIRSGLQCGSRVLIHGASGALGQAAIYIALAHGCKVFATVSDKAKKRFLLKLFPQLNENNIGNSRDETFGDMILHATQGARCDIVLSCVRGRLKHVSEKCAGRSGYIINLDNTVCNRDEVKFGMFNLTEERSCISADFSSLISYEKIEILQKLQLLVSEGIARGYVVPLTRVTFAPHEAARAFRLLAASRHRGRVLLTLRDQSAPVTPRVTCSSARVQLIVWDGSSFGLQLADRLIARGAKKVCILNLSPTSQQPLIYIRLWKALGVDVKIISNTENLDENSVRELLTDMAKQYSIESIYISFIEADLDCLSNIKIEKLIDVLHITSRKMQSLKHFAVLTTKSKIGQELCLSRAKEGLPANTLQFPVYKKVIDNHELLEEEAYWNQCAVNTTERALLSKHTVLLAQPPSKEIPSLRKIIPALANVSEDDVSLEDMKLSESLPYIQSFLRNVCNITLDDEDVLKLTKKKILQIEKETLNFHFEEVNGLGVFFSEVDDDELQGTCDIISMNTLVTRVETLMGGMDSSNGSHLFIIPGLEGHHARFRTLCERLKLPAMVLQPGLDHPWETSREQAERYSKILLERFKLTTNFYLLGYEFGIDVALEVAAILEDHGLTGTVYCVGDGPEELRAQLEAELSAFSSMCALEEGVVRHVCSLLSRSPPSRSPPSRSPPSRSPPAELELTLRACCSWQQRVECGVRALLGRTPHTAQYVRALLQAAHARVATARRTAAAPRALRSRLVLLRARRDRRDLPPGCSLQRYSRDPLPLHRLAAPLAHAATDLAVPVIINRYLDDTLLEKETRYPDENKAQSLENTHKHNSDAHTPSDNHPMEREVAVTVAAVSPVADDITTADLAMNHSQ